MRSPSEKSCYLLKLSITDLRLSVKNAVSGSLSVPLSFWMTGTKCDCSNRLLLDLYVHIVLSMVKRTWIVCALLCMCVHMCMCV